MQIADHFLEAESCGEIELGRAKCLALEAVRGQPLEYVERGDRSAVGKIEDRMGRREQDLSSRGAAAKVRGTRSVWEKAGGAVMGVGSQGSPGAERFAECTRIWNGKKFGFHHSDTEVTEKAAGRRPESIVAEHHPNSINLRIIPC